MEQNRPTGRVLAQRSSSSSGPGGRTYQAPEKGRLRPGCQQVVGRREKRRFSYGKTEQKTWQMEARSLKADVRLSEHFGVWGRHGPHLTWPKAGLLHSLTSMPPSHLV